MRSKDPAFLSLSGIDRCNQKLNGHTSLVSVTRCLDNFSLAAGQSLPARADLK